MGKKYNNFFLTKEEAFSIINERIDSFRSQDNSNLIFLFVNRELHLSHFISVIFQNLHGADIELIRDYCKHLCDDNYEEENLVRDIVTHNPHEIINYLLPIITFSVNKLYEEIEWERCSVK